MTLLVFKFIVMSISIKKSDILYNAIGMQIERRNKQSERERERDKDNRRDKKKDYTPA